MEEQKRGQSHRQVKGEFAEVVMRRETWKIYVEVTGGERQRSLRRQQEWNRGVCESMTRCGENSKSYAKSCAETVTKHKVLRHDAPLEWEIFYSFIYPQCGTMQHVRLWHDQISDQKVKCGQYKQRSAGLEGTVKEGWQFLGEVSVCGRPGRRPPLSHSWQRPAVPLRSHLLAVWGAGNRPHVVCGALWHSASPPPLHCDGSVKACAPRQGLPQA